MSKSLGPAMVVAVVGVVSCDGTTATPFPDSLPRANANDDSVSDNAGGPSPNEVGGADAGACDPAAPLGVEQWRRQFAEDDVLKAASVASDDVSGGAFVSRAEGETLRIDGSGALAWKQPFGSIVSADGRGGAYVAGTFTGSVQIGARTLVSGGGTDVYVAHLDGSGQARFAAALGGAEDDSAVGIAAGPDGSVVVSGQGIGTVALGPDGRTAFSVGAFGHVAIDSTGAVVLAGGFTGTTQVGNVTLTSAGGEDVFIAKLGSTGNTVWARRFGDAGVEQRGEGVAVGPSDDIVVTGVIDGTADFGGGPLGVKPGTCPAEVWCKDAGFVLSLDASGGHRWSVARAPVRALPGVAVDYQGNVVASGASPGNAPPYRIPLLLRFDSQGAELRNPPAFVGEWITAGAGYGIAVDRCNGVLWTVTRSPSPAMTGDSVLLKLAR